MKRILLIAALLLASSAAFSQQLVDCAPSTPCTPTGPFGTAGADNAAAGFGKLNQNDTALWTIYSVIPSAVFPSAGLYPAEAYGSNGILVGLGGTPCPWVNGSIGSTAGDNMLCVQSAANAAGAAGAGVVWTPPGNYNFLTAFSMSYSAVSFLGGGIGITNGAPSNGTAVAATFFTYGGAVNHNGTTPTVAFYVGQPTQASIYALSINGIGIDCNLGLDIGLELQQVVSSSGQLVVRNCLQGEVWKTTNGGTKGDGTQDDDMRFITYSSGTTANGNTYAPIGVYLDGEDQGSPGYNVSLSHYGQITVNTCNGDAVVVADTDNLDFAEVRAFIGAGCNGRQMKFANPTFVSNCAGTYYGCPPSYHHVNGRPGHYAEATVHKAHIAVQVDGLQDGSTWTNGGGNVAQLATLTGITTAAANAEQNTLTFASFTSTGSGSVPSAPIAGMVANCQYNGANPTGTGTANTTNTAISATGGHGSGAVATIITNATGAITSFVLTTPGTGYLVGDTLSFAIAGGTVTTSVSTGQPICGIPDNDVVAAVTGSGPYTVVLRSQIGGSEINAVSSLGAQGIASGTFVTFASGFTDTAFYSPTALTPYVVSTNGTTLSTTAPGGNPGGTAQSGVAQSGNCAIFIDFVICWSGTLTSGDTFTLQPSQPQWDVAILGVDRDNTKPISAAEAGARVASAFTGDALHYFGPPMHVTLGVNAGTAAATGSAVPYGNNLSIGNNVGTIFPQAGLNDVVICLSALCDPATDASNYLALGGAYGAIMTTTGTNVPSTSATVFQGSIQALGGLLPPAPGNNFAPSEIDLTDFGLNGVQTAGGTGGSGTANTTNTGIVATGGTGTGATATIITNGAGNIMSFTLTAPGQNYTIGDSLTFTIAGGSATRTVYQLRNPILRWDASSAGTNFGMWECQATAVPSTSGTFSCYARGDTGAAVHNWLSIARGSGSAEALNTIYLGNATDNPAYNFLGTGAVAAGGPVEAGGAVTAHGGYQTPYILAQWGVPMIIPGLGTGSAISTSGVFTPGTTSAFTVNYCASGCYMYFPADAFTASSAAGLYYGVCSSVTVCQMYQNVWTPTTTAGPPTIPGSLTSWGTIAGSTTPTQTTATDIQLVSISMPAGAMGNNGAVEFTAQMMRPSNTDTVSARLWAATTVGTEASTWGNFQVASVQWLGLCRTIRNDGVANQQIVDASSNATPCDQTSVNATPTLTTINSANASYLTVSGNLTTAGTDYMVLMGGKFVVSYSP